MKKLYSLLLCAVFAIILAPDVKSAPIIDNNECTICCEQMNCIFMCDTIHSGNVTILVSIYEFEITQCNGDSMCQAAAYHSHTTLMNNSFATNLVCVSDCVIEHP